MLHQGGAYFHSFLSALKTWVEPVTLSRRSERTSVCPSHLLLAEYQRHTLIIAGTLISLRLLSGQGLSAEAVDRLQNQIASLERSAQHSKKEEKRKHFIIRRKKLYDKIKFYGMRVLLLRWCRTSRTASTSVAPYICSEV